MSSKSTLIGKRVINGIDEIEAGALDGIHSSAQGARRATKAGAHWASQHEVNATHKARQLQQRAEQQTAHIAKAAGKSAKLLMTTVKESASAGRQHIKKHPWSAVAVTSAAALAVGALLGRRRR